MKFTFALLLILILGSCGCSKNCQPEIQIVENTVTKREIIHDTIFQTAPDSSQAKFQLVTDQKTGALKAVPVQSTPGRILNVPKVNIKDDILTVDCDAKAEKLFAQWKETYIDSVSKTVITKTNTVEVEKDLSTWQHIQIWLGRAFIVVFIALLYLMYKRYWPKPKV